MRIVESNWMQIEAYLEHDDRIVLPTGSTEQHGYLSLGTDAILAERVAAEACAPIGVPVLPVLSYGLAPYFAAYPGSLTLRVTTYLAVVRDLLDSLAQQGFRRIVLVNGHGGNSPVVGLLREWIAERAADHVQVLFHNWYDAPATAAVASRHDDRQFHGSWVENFPWTRLAGVEIPAGESAVIERSIVGALAPAEIRRRVPDGVMGGPYQIGEAAMAEIWEAGVAETRAVIEHGWVGS